MLNKSFSPNAGAAARHGQQHFDMPLTNPLLVSLDEGRSRGADEIGNLERRPVTEEPPPKTVTHTYIKTARQSALRSTMRSVRRTGGYVQTR